MNHPTCCEKCTRKVLEKTASGHRTVKVCDDARCNCHMVYAESHHLYCTKEKAKGMARKYFVMGEVKGMDTTRAIMSGAPAPYFNLAAFERGMDEFLNAVEIQNE